MTHTVVGLFDNRSEAQAAMQELVQQGFIKDHIDLSNRTYGDGATTATTATTAQTTTGTAAGDSISNFFSSLFGGDDATASSYTNAAQEADAILTVQVDSEERARQAAEILDRNGAIDVDERLAQYNRQNFSETATSNTTGTMDTATMNAARNNAELQNEAVIPVVEEELQVGKREVERGGARIRSRIIERPVEASVRLREEHVVVRRRPVNREVSEADLANFREGEIELTERAEVPVVGKQARVVEEIEVGKTVEEHEETIRDTVRRTDVDVEEFDETSNTGTRRATS
jgi:uncharacterized protein (TIGR02271 family)